MTREEITAVFLKHLDEFYEFARKAAVRRGRTREDGEDAVHGVYVKLVGSPHQWPRIDDVDGFVRSRIVYALMWKLGQRRAEDTGGTPDPKDPRPPVPWLDAADCRRYLEQAVADLTEAERRCVLLTFGIGDREQVKRELGLTKSAVYSATDRGKDKLFPRLQHACQMYVSDSEHANPEAREFFKVFEEVLLKASRGPAAKPQESM